MNAFIDHARRAIDAVFEHFGVTAAYTPPGGSAAVPCIIMDDRADRELTGFSGRPLMQANMFRVRRSEIAAPAAGGVFVVDGASFTVVGDPRSDGPFRLEWACTVE